MEYKFIDDDFIYVETLASGATKATYDTENSEDFYYGVELYNYGTDISGAPTYWEAEFTDRNRPIVLTWQNLNYHFRVFIGVEISFLDNGESVA